MARNGKDLEAVSWLGIVVLDVVHLFQGPERCQTEYRRSYGVNNPQITK